jgi:hypothetical protein
VRPPAHRRIDEKLPDMKAADVDVYVRQQRRVGIARVEHGQAHQPRPRDVQLLDVDMIAEIGERPIIDAGDGRVEEGAARILQRQIVDGEIAKDRAFDPADIDVEAGSGLEIVDLADDEAPSRIAVQPDQEGDDQDDQDRDGDAHPFGDAPRNVALAAAGPRLGDRPVGERLVGVNGRLARHQKACPIDM